VTTPDGPDSNTAQLLQALKDNARRLGLTWQIALASVVDGDDPGAIALQFDSDDTTTPGAISIIGYLAPGDRVYVIQVPPAGSYIVGRTTGPYRARRTVTSAQATVHFGNIPSNLRSLSLRFKARTDAAAQIVAVVMQVNGDTTAAYSSEVSHAQNAAVTASSLITTSGQVGLATAALSTAGRFGSGIAEIEGWDLLGQALSWDFNSTALGSAAANFFHDVGGVVYSGLVGRTSLDILTTGGLLQPGSDFQLYGEPS
jgi:hypothetical protein